MKAMILASGTGSRLSSAVEGIPKCMVSVKETKSILEMLLDNFIYYNIKEVIITTGPFREKIHILIKEKYNELDVRLVYNEKFNSTNYIYSMHKCASFIDDDFVLVHGDLVFERRLLGKLLLPENSAVCMDRSAALPEKDFKGRIVDGKVRKIGIDVFGEGVYFLAPLYKLKKQDFSRWMEKISEFVKEGRVHEYAENAFNEISGSLQLIPVFYDGLFCSEIDTPDDLRAVREYIIHATEM